MLGEIGQLQSNLRKRAAILPDRLLTISELADFVGTTRGPTKIVHYQGDNGKLSSNFFWEVDVGPELSGDK